MGETRSQRAMREREVWSDVFRREIERIQSSSWQRFSSPWWELYYAEMADKIDPLLDGYAGARVLEVGSGSGKATLLLRRRCFRTLLDFAPPALEFASLLAMKLGIEDVTFVRADAFRAPFRDSSFSLVWNIGMVEHYDGADARDLVREMMRVARDEGTIALGIPNHWSGPIVKARLISLPGLRWIPGYKVDSEIWYSVPKLLNILQSAARFEGVECSGITVARIGSALPMETPRFLLTAARPMIDRYFQSFKFLTLITAHICKRPSEVHNAGAL